MQTQQSPYTREGGRMMLSLSLPGQAGSAIRWVPEAYLMFTAISR